MRLMLPQPKRLAAVIAAALAACILVAPGAGAQESEDAERLREELQTLEAEIRKFREMLEQTQNDRASLEDTLQLNEKEISDIIRRIESIQRELKSGEDKVSSLNQERRSLENARTEQQALIRQQIRAAYAIGNQEYLKVVLNQEDPNRLARMITYYDYFNEARAEQIQAYRSTISSLQAVQAEIAATNASLRDSRNELQSRRTTLQAVRADKEATLARLNRSIRETGQEIEIREQDRERLEALLERIRASVVNLPTPGDTVSFAARKGELLMPIAGSVSNPFGSARAGGKLRWNGVFIEAPPGTPVSAVHYGRVVFSDWLRGFGLLLIVDHGEGYMSLYGHNEVLYRETGDWIVAGETIATVGDTGGQNRSGLYFEIRHAGTPTDPLNWCQIRSADSQA